MNITKIINRFRIVLAMILLIPTLLFCFYLLSLFVNHSLGLLFLLSVIALFGYWLNKKMNEFTLNQFSKLDEIFEVFKDLVIPNILLKIKRVGTDMCFPLVLLAIGADPIKDLVELRPVKYQFNYLFFDLALFILFISFLPMIVWFFYKALRESIDKYW